MLLDFFSFLLSKFFDYKTIEHESDLRELGLLVVFHGTDADGFVIDLELDFLLFFFKLTTSTETEISEDIIVIDVGLGVVLELSFDVGDVLEFFDEDKD